MAPFSACFSLFHLLFLVRRHDIEVGSKFCSTLTPKRAQGVPRYPPELPSPPPEGREYAEAGLDLKILAKKP